MFLFVRRYLFAKKSHSVVNIITALSLVSVSLPVAAVIILLSVFNGFGELIQNTSRTVDPDLTVQRSHGNFFDVEALDLNALASIEGVEALSMVSEQTVLLEHNGQQLVATLRGVDSLYLSVVPLHESVVRGEFQTSLGELDRIVLGRSLAYRIGATNPIDSYVEIYSLKGSGFSSLLPMSNYIKRKVKLSGLFTADMQSEDRYAITSLRAVQGLTSSQGRATNIFVKVASGANEQRVKSALSEAVGEDFVVMNRYDRNPMLYDVVDYEKWGVLFISTLIMLLASFTLIGALSMLIIEKRENISTLRAMGASWSFVRNIFFGEGLLISSVGVVLGVVVGSCVTLLQQHFALVKLPAQTFLSDSYPVVLLSSDIAIVVVLSLLISTLLSYVVVRQMIKNK